MKIFNLVRKLYPESTGDFIGRLRLADYGALLSFFQPAQIFTELKHGSEAAGVRMYESIASGVVTDSPLLQVASFKVGLGFYNMQNNKRAIDTFKRFCRSDGKAVQDDTRYLLARPCSRRSDTCTGRAVSSNVIQFYTENKALISEDTWPRSGITWAGPPEAEPAAGSGPASGSQRRADRHGGREAVCSGPAYYQAGRYDRPEDRGQAAKRLP